MSSSFFREGGKSQRPKIKSAQNILDESDRGDTDDNIYTNVREEVLFYVDF